ncbi:hypothetical protein [Legionella brunensis]|uniref:hypothetical protein n=1 Tax=Legionella brunensis TaxID=29422 RepID=UPI0010418830|nr:hypothetical protein [Legionella brunensis]
MKFVVDDKQVRILLHNFVDEEKLRAHFIRKSEALLPIESRKDILSQITKAIITYSEGDLFIDALTDEQVACANGRLKQIPQILLGDGDLGENYKRVNRLVEYLDQLSHTNNMNIADWMKFYQFPQFYYNYHEPDQRFTGISSLPIRYQIHCPKQHVSQLFKTLKADANSYSMPEQIFLLEILWKLKSHDYIVHGGGKLIKNKKYATSAGGIVKKIEDLLATKIDFQENSTIAGFRQKAQELLQDIGDELKHKKTAQTSKSFGWWGHRDQTTITLYNEILDITNHVTPSILEHAVLRKTLSKLQSHRYIINGLGKTVAGKKYTTSAGNIVEKIEIFLDKRINYKNLVEVEHLQEEAQELLRGIINELSGKTISTTGYCFNLGGRAPSTAKLYSEILDICSNHCIIAGNTARLTT